ncbi:MAG: PepSY domain-containing protein [Croceibacterium sp.]
MTRRLIAGTALAILLIGGVAAANSTHASAPAAHPAHAPAAKITMAQARAIALSMAPGKIISSEYENEGGGWRYSFDIQQRNHIQEIGIDGQTGRIVENASEGRKDND